MNAPVPATAIELQSLQHVALASLTLSRTHIQELRRARFTKEATAELALSIGKVGILQAIVARPLDGSKFEIVAGERRFLAAKQAGLAVLPVNVRELTDEQVLEVQLIENLQREGLHELEEAEGYDELMKLKKINADVVAGMVGKSRSYVYARTKLLALCPEARKAFYAGELDSSKALLIARIGHHDTQRAALKELAGAKWGEPMTYREAHHHILDTYMLKLKAAPFALDDATLVPKAGTCTACPKRTGNQKDLFADVKDADVCTDPKCFADKRDAHFERKRIAAEKAGKKVIAGADAKAIFPTSYGDRVAGGYVAMDAICYDDPKRRKIGEILAKNPELIELVQHPQDKRLVEVARSSAVTEVLNERGIKTHRQKVAESTAKTRKQGTAKKEDEKLQAEIARQQALAIYKAVPAKVGRKELLVLFEDMVDNYEFEANVELDAILALPLSEDGASETVVLKKLAALSEADLTRAFVTALICNARVSYNGHNAAKLLAGVKVDLKKIEADVRKAAKQGPPLPRGQAGFKASRSLAVIVGAHPIAKTDALKKINAYIDEHKLRDGKYVKLDVAMKAALGKQVPRVMQFELPGMVEAQMTLAVSAWPFPTGAKSPAHQAAKKKPVAKKKAITKKSAKKKPACS
jgi:ParB/RepB/Spo0J family partition protein